MGRATMLSMAAWVLVGACSGNQDDTPRSDAAGLSVECERFDEVVAEGG